jgi:hypothetical protein
VPNQDISSQPLRITERQGLKMQKDTALAVNRVIISKININKEPNNKIELLLILSLLIILSNINNTLVLEVSLILFLFNALTHLGTN